MRIFEYVMNSTFTLDTELFPVVAARFQALADPGRLAILDALGSGERTVLEIARATGRSQPNVSQHLSRLARGGFVDCRREGNRIHWRIVDLHLSRICSAVCEGLADWLASGTRRSRTAPAIPERPRNENRKNRNEPT